MVHLIVWQLKLGWFDLKQCARPCLKDVAKVLLLPWRWCCSSPLPGSRVLLEEVLFWKLGICLAQVALALFDLCLHYTYVTFCDIHLIVFHDAHSERCSGCCLIIVLLFSLVADPEKNVLHGQGSPNTISFSMYFSNFLAYIYIFIYLLGRW